LEGYIGVTSREWFTFLSKNEPTGEINFWRKNTNNFKRLSKGDPFFFLVKNEKGVKGERYVLGSASFERFEVLALNEAWNRYEEGNGDSRKEYFLKRMKNMFGNINNIEKTGCIILSDMQTFDTPVLLSELNIEFKNSVVSGKYISSFEALSVLNKGAPSKEDIVNGFHSEVAPAIRLLPMSGSDPTFIDKSIEDLQEWIKTKLLDGTYLYKTRMETSRGTLVLFQFNNHVIASAVLKEIKIFEKRTVEGYTGEYKFVSSSIRVFNPITSEEIRRIWNDFKHFSQSMQKLDINQYHQLRNLLDEKTMDYLFVENEASFQEEIQRTELSFPIIVDDVPKELLSRGIVSKATRWKRNLATAKKAIVLSDYKCEYDQTHLFFKSSVTNENYVEAHHLIPMEFQVEFGKSIDVEANIVSLCPLCHKALHHAIFENKKPILRKLFELKRERLAKCDIVIEFKELVDLYRK